MPRMNDRNSSNLAVTFILKHKALAAQEVFLLCFVLPSHSMPLAINQGRCSKRVHSEELAASGRPRSPRFRELCKTVCAISAEGQQEHISFVIALNRSRLRRATVISTVSTGSRVLLKLDNGEERLVDHVVIGTGYEVDISKYPFLSQIWERPASGYTPR